MCKLLCMGPPRVESLFPEVLLKSCNQIPLAFKVWFFGNFSSHCQTPRLGSLTWGSEPSLQWVDFCGITVLQFVSHLPSSYGIWLYCDCAPPTTSFWLLLCLWMWGIFFGEFQCLPVDDCSAVVIPVPSKEVVSTHPSTLPSWTTICLKQSPGVTPHCVQQMAGRTPGQDRAAVFSQGFLIDVCKDDPLILLVKVLVIF